MKLCIFQSKQIPEDEIQIHTHPINLSIAKQMNIQEETLSIEVYDGRTHSQKLISLTKIESFQAMDQYCQVRLINQETYLYQKRLKTLSNLETYGFCQINHSEIISLNQIDRFSVEKHARLALTTYSNNEYIVSRHYQKVLKERLNNETVL